MHKISVRHCCLPLSPSPLQPPVQYGAVRGAPLSLGLIQIPAPPTYLAPSVYPDHIQPVRALSVKVAPEWIVSGGGLREPFIPAGGWSEGIVSGSGLREPFIPAGGWGVRGDHQGLREPFVEIKAG